MMNDRHTSRITHLSECGSKRWQVYAEPQKCTALFLRFIDYNKTIDNSDAADFYNDKQDTHLRTEKCEKRSEC